VSHALIALTIFLATLAASLLFVSRAIRIAAYLGILDQPAPRRVHTVPVPRFGGVAVFLAFTLGVTLSVVLDVQRFGPEIERLVLLLGGAALVTGITVEDDVLGLSPLVKLAAQVGAALVVVAPRLRGPDHGIVIEQFNAPLAGVVRLPLLIALGFTVFWIVGMMNTLNFVDGLDGLASSVTLVACGVLFLHTYFWPRNDPQFTISLLPVALGAAALGFLRFNWHPSRIILGDAGANFLGFTLAVISIIGGAKIATALLALGLPILDVAWVILYRLTHGRSPLHADRGHLHHRLLDAGWSQAQIVAFVAGISALFGIGALLLPGRTTKLIAFVVVGLVLLATVSLLASRDRGRCTGPGEDLSAAQRP
jgi:UDP-N-acetylmuramyl pentapeptide phosphotransferase/UDP-N-acetylglucosamine-1-phosphate transferase